jgi:hypothetical protein
MTVGAWSLEMSMYKAPKWHRNIIEAIRLPKTAFSRYSIRPMYSLGAPGGGQPQRKKSGEAARDKPSIGRRPAEITAEVTAESS